MYHTHIHTHIKYTKTVVLNEVEVKAILVLSNLFFGVTGLGCHMSSTSHRVVDFTRYVVASLVK